MTVTCTFLKPVWPVSTQLLPVYQLLDHRVSKCCCRHHDHCAAARQPSVSAEPLVASDAFQASDTSEASDAFGALDASEASDAFEAFDASEAPHASEAPDASDILQAAKHRLMKDATEQLLQMSGESLFYIKESRSEKKVLHEADVHEAVKHYAPKVYGHLRVSFLLFQSAFFSLLSVDINFEWD